MLAQPFKTSFISRASRLSRGFVVLGALGSALVPAGCGGAHPGHAAGPPEATVSEPPNPPSDLPAVTGSSTFEVPKVGGVVVDGDAVDWKTGGLAVDVLSALPSDSREDDFDVRARIGWDERGLLLVCEVTDATRREAEPIWQADGFEIFLGDQVGGKNVAHFIVAPGLAPDFPELRQKFEDQRSDAVKKAQPAEAVEGSFARKRTDKGYSIEGLVPWRLLGAKPEPGKTFALQFYVNDGRQGRPSRQLLFYPMNGTYMDSKRMQPIRLTDHAAPPVTFATSAAVRGFGVHVALNTSVLPKDVRLVDHGKEIARPTFQKKGRFWTSEFDVPADGEKFGPVDVVSEGVSRGQVEVLDLPYQRRLALNRVAVVAKPSVFSSAQFPAIDFDQPALAKEQLGPVTLSTKFYDSEHRLVTTADKPGRYGAVVDVASPTGKSYRKRITLFRLPDNLRWRDLRIDADVTFSRDLGITPSVLKTQKRVVGDWMKGAIVDSSNHGDLSASVLANLFERSGPKDATPAKPGASKAPATKPAPAPASNFSRDDPAAVSRRWWHEQQKRDGDLESYRYVVSAPEGSKAGSKTQFPLILFLHGSGERGHDLGKLAGWGPLGAADRAGKSFPFIVVAPQCPEEEGWNPTQLDDLLAEIEAKYSVDRDRIYLTGLSMGGFGSWTWAAEDPSRFAAMAPVCGGGEVADATVFKDLPIWVFHGEKDDAVPAARGKEMVSAIRGEHGRILFTLYPEYGHSSWTPTYKNDELYAWFLKQKRAVPNQDRSTLKGDKADFVAPDKPENP